MPNTFITFIGKGKKIAEAKFGYEKTAYNLGDKTIDASFFANALLQSGLYRFDRLVVIGTWGSSWSQFLEYDCEDSNNETPFLELFLELDEARDNPEKLEPLLGQLKEFLKRRWNIAEVELVLVPSTLPGNEEQINNAFLQVLLNIPPNDSIILDVTHSFRWMPQFFTSALQMAEAIASTPRDLRIIYGELSGSDGKSKCSKLLKLDSLWETRQIAQHIRLFTEKFEGNALAADIEELWPAGAKAIKILGEHLQGNFLLPLVLDTDCTRLGRPFLMLKKALEDFPDSMPSWLRGVKDFLEKLYKKFSKIDTASRRLLALAELYAGHQMYGYALISQECALRIFWEEEKNGGKIPQYPEWNKLEKTKKEIIDNYDLRDKAKIQIFKIFRSRNTVAHGAIESGENGGARAVENLPAQYAAQQTFLRRLILGEA